MDNAVHRAKAIYNTVSLTIGSYSSPHSPKGLTLLRAQRGLASRNWRVLGHFPWFPTVSMGKWSGNCGIPTLQGVHATGPVSGMVHLQAGN